ncbi:MAG: hypothetical protein K8R85_00675 [Bacteroidetes bacterium]|nr:hypothetical protein [Bacteroidota bacterium]
MIIAIQLLLLTIFIDQILQLAKFIIAVKQVIADMEKEKEVSVYTVFINADGKLFYEDQFSIALIDGIVKERKVKISDEIKFGSKYITQKK